MDSAIRWALNLSLGFPQRSSVCYSFPVVRFHVCKCHRITSSIVLLLARYKKRSERS
jgi:hypothetical protein